MMNPELTDYNGTLAGYWQLVAESKAIADAQDPLVDIIIDVLEWECKIHDDEPGPTRTLTVFHGQEPPGMSLREYFERVKCFSGASSCCFVLAASYLHTLRRLDDAYKPNSYNVHRLMLIALMVANKFADDKFYTNKYWAKVGGLPLDELNGLEREFLSIINFNLHVKPEEYHHFAVGLRRQHQSMRGQQPPGTHWPPVLPADTRQSACT